MLRTESTFQRCIDYVDIAGWPNWGPMKWVASLFTTAVARLPLRQLGFLVDCNGKIIQKGLHFAKNICKYVMSMFVELDSWHEAIFIVFVHNLLKAKIMS